MSNTKRPTDALRRSCCLSGGPITAGELERLGAHGHEKPPLANLRAAFSAAEKLGAGVGPWGDLFVEIAEQASRNGMDAHDARVAWLMGFGAFETARGYGRFWTAPGGRGGR
jgi:hypothetical protein